MALPCRLDVHQALSRLKDLDNWPLALVTLVTEYISHDRLVISSLKRRFCLVDGPMDLEQTRAFNRQHANGHPGTHRISHDRKGRWRFCPCKLQFVTSDGAQTTKTTTATRTNNDPSYCEFKS